MQMSEPSIRTSESGRQALSPKPGGWSGEEHTGARVLLQPQVCTVILGSSTRLVSRRFSRSPFTLLLTSRSIRLKASWSVDGGERYYLRYATMGSDCLTVLMNALEILRIATHIGCFYCYEVQILSLSRRAGRDEPSGSKLVRTSCHLDFLQRTQ